MTAAPPNWWPAKELLTEFQVWGRFYETRIAGQLERLRSHLELFPVGWSPERAIEGQADLVVVMMNPGASEPLPNLQACGEFEPTRPDTTQYQILRLMRRAQALGLPWKHARVLNLSDLRTPKSAELFVKLTLYAADHRHSIFAAHRRSELKLALGAERTPVLLAWGLNPSLRERAACAQTALAGHPSLGLLVTSGAYRHPLPQRADLQKAWLDGVEAQIRAKAVGEQSRVILP